MTRVRKTLTILLLLGRSLPNTAEAQQTQNDPQASADQGNTTAPPRPLRVRVSQGVAVGLLVTTVNPVYPKDVRKKRIQGLVTLIDPNQSRGMSARGRSFQ